MILHKVLIDLVLQILCIFMCLFYSGVFVIVDCFGRKRKYFLSLTSPTDMYFFWSELFLSWAVVYLDLMSLFLFPDLEVDGKSFHRFRVQQLVFFPSSSAVALTLKEFNFLFWNHFKLKENQGMTEKKIGLLTIWVLSVECKCRCRNLWACSMQVLIPDCFQTVLCGILRAGKN